MLYQLSYAHHRANASSLRHFPCAEKQGSGPGQAPIPCGKLDSASLRNSPWSLRTCCCSRCTRDESSPLRFAAVSTAIAVLPRATWRTAVVFRSCAHFNTATSASSGRRRRTTSPSPSKDNRPLRQPAPSVVCPSRARPLRRPARAGRARLPDAIFPPLQGSTAESFRSATQSKRLGRGR